MTLVGILLAAGYTLTRPVEYTATSTAQVVAGSSEDANTAMMAQTLSSSRAATYGELAGSGAVAQRVAKASNGALKAGEFTVKGAAAPSSAAVTLEATAGSAADAQLAANLARQALADEAQHLETLGAKKTIYRVFPMSQAARPSAPSSPHWPLNLAVGAILGLISGLIIVVLRKQLDSRIRHTSELEKITGAGVLGVIPKAKNLKTQSRGGLGSLGHTSEAFRMLRTNLRYVSAEQPPRSLVITSAVQGEGKSTVAANLARVLAAAGEPVILVDTDLRRPVVHDTFEVDNSIGLTEVLTGQATLPQVIQRGDHKNLSLVTSGRIPPNPSELLGSRRMSAIIEALSHDYFVILDAPPLLPVTDAGLLAVAADGAAVVYHHGRTHREQAALCTKILSQVGADYYGSVLNMTPEKEMGSAIYGYGAGNYGATGYGYGYGYGQTDETQEANALTPAPESKDLLLDPEADSRPMAPLAPTTSAPRERSSVDVVTSTTTPAAAAHASGASRADATTDAAAPEAGSGLSSEWSANQAPPSRRSIRRGRAE